MRSRRTAALLPLALFALGAVVGCIPAGEMPVPSTSPTVATPTATSTPKPSPTPTPTTGPDAIPYSAPCDQLLTSDTVYAFDPNFALLGTFDPAPGSLAAEVQAAGGTLCRWIHSTSSVTVDVAIADLSEEASASKIAALTGAGLAVDDFGPNGFFGVEGDAGRAQAFPSHYWVTLVSPIFSVPGDAASLMGSLTSAL